jgi:hypothetical protein
MFKYFKANSVNVLTLGSISGLFCAAFFIRNSQNAHQTWHILLLVGMVISLFAGLFNYWRLLKISEAPISTIAAAAQGYIELQGVASCEKPLKTPYHGIACVWYRAWVFANRTQHGNNAGIDDNILMNWRLLDYTESQLTFTLTDKTGQCHVNPTGAEVIHFEARTWRKNDHRYVEEYLPTGKPLYVLGQLDTRHDVLEDAAANKYLSEKLANWKANKQQLLHRFDQNRDGKIDMMEWEQARLEAHQQVLAEHGMRKGTGAFTLKKPTDHHLFLISAQSPQQLRARYQYWVIRHLVILGVLAFLWLTFY